ncbi:MAG: polysaccharide deacetylase family protein, partial [Alphaproteobacteria bacterium]|nr:polysaccharide deacetylase family protein [Alphaproteobacteria bacterium]
MMLAALFAASGLCARPHSEQVAFTFDDLPGLSLSTSQEFVTAYNTRLIAGLRRHHIPATGFVNEGKLDALVRERQIDILKMWLDAGFALGNHTYSHISPNAVGAKAYTNDIARGAVETRALDAAHGITLHWFRHPYLETGTPADEKHKIDHWLLENRYTIAPVTMENSDWMFSEPYDDALMRHDEAAASHIKAAYLAYTAYIVPWYRRAGHALLGRGMSYVMLLHSTRLNADTIDKLAEIFA